MCSHNFVATSASARAVRRIPSSPARADLQHAAGFQPDQGLADRGAGDLEQRGQRLFAQSRAGPNGAGKYGVDDDPVDGLLIHEGRPSSLYTSLIRKACAMPSADALFWR